MKALLLGSACAAEIYGMRGRSPEIAGVIFESGAVDLAALVRRRGLVVPLDFDPSERATFDPIPKLQRGRHPFLVIHGSNDVLISPNEAEQAFGAAGALPSDKRLVIVPERGHNDVSWSTVYWTAIETFLQGLPLV